MALPALALFLGESGILRLGSSSSPAELGAVAPQRGCFSVGLSSTASPGSGRRGLAVVAEGAGSSERTPPGQGPVVSGLSTQGGLACPGSGRRRGCGASECCFSLVTAVCHGCELWLGKCCTPSPVQGVTCPQIAWEAERRQPKGFDNGGVSNSLALV